jgi:uncharacterized protein YyaL (SSP411 family)
MVPMPSKTTIDGKPLEQLVSENKITKKIVNIDKIIIIYLKEGEKIDLLSNDRPYKIGGVAYLCQNQTCLPAIHSTQELLNYLIPS